MPYSIPALIGVGEQRHAPAALSQAKRLIIHSIGGYVGLGAGLDGPENIAAPGFKPQTIQALASHYAGYDIPVVYMYIYIYNIYFSFIYLFI
jgi:hypothetical protein